MKLIWRFIRPHWKLFTLTVLLLVIDVAGSLLIPTLAAQMLNFGISGHSFQKLIETGLWMAAASLVSGICAILGGYACAALSARVGQDMRVAVYDKSLKLSVSDFRQLGTASLTTRTISDITNIPVSYTHLDVYKRQHRFLFLHPIDATGEIQPDQCDLLFRLQRERVLA